MILHSIDRSKGSIKQNGRFFIVKLTSKVSLAKNDYTTIDLDLHLGTDDGTIILIESALDHPLEVLNKSFYGVGKMYIMVYNPTDQEIVLDPGNNLIHCIPVTTAYFGQIEMEEVKKEFFETTERVMIG